MIMIPYSQLSRDYKWVALILFPLLTTRLFHGILHVHANKGVFNQTNTITIHVHRYKLKNCANCLNLFPKLFVLFVALKDSADYDWFHTQLTLINFISSRQIYLRVYIINEKTINISIVNNKIYIFSVTIFVFFKYN